MRQILLSINVSIEELPLIKNVNSIDLKQLSELNIDFDFNKKYEYLVNYLKENTHEDLMFVGAFNSLRDYKSLKEILELNNFKIGKIFYKFNHINKENNLRKRSNMESYSADDEFGFTLLYLLEMNNLFREILNDRIEICFV